MSHKSRTRMYAGIVLSWIRPLLIAGVLLVFLRVTGLISSVSYVTQWTLLQTGLRDADNEADTEARTFDYNFNIKDLEGNTIPFENFRGKVIFLNMWATWCGPCRAEMPGIQALYEKVNKENVVFVMLSIDKDSDIPKVTNYLAAKSFTFGAYLPSGYLPEQLRVPSIPTTFIISTEGKIVKKEVGTLQYDTPEFREFLEGLSQ